MKKYLIFSTAILASLIFLVSYSYKTDGYKVGDTATDFKLKNIDGRMISMADYKDAKGFVVIFSCNHCPFVIASEDRMVALDKKFSALGYPVIAINSNDPAAYPDDSFDKMKERAKEKGFTFPYLVDETQDIAKRYGATKTPDVFILNKEKANGVEKLIVRYTGSIDNSVKDASIVTETYAVDAINALLKGEKVSVEATKSIGCSIKWKEKSEKR